MNSTEKDLHRGSWNRLSFRFLIPLIIIFLILLSTYTIYVVNDYYHDERLEFEERFLQTLQLVSNISAGYLWNFNFDELEENLEYFFVNQELFSIAILDDKEETILFLERENTLANELLYDGMDIFYNELYLGEAQISFTAYYYLKRVNELRNQLLFLSVIIFGVLISVIWFTSKILITDPIYRLSDKLQQFADGDFNTIPPSLIPSSIMGRRDELGVLGQGFDMMSAKLRSMIEDLEDQKQKLRQISYHDILTGLYNRTFLEEEIHRLDTPRQLPISIIMVDINGLKLINDTYGHDKGDELLIETAKILTRSIRQEDLVARWAGDEFVILLPQTSEEEAKKVFQRIKTNCKEYKGPFPVSLGMGMAIKREEDQDIYVVLNEADDRMYHNKLSESRRAKKRLIQGLLLALESNSYETKDHTLQMERLALTMGERLGLSAYDLERISLLSTLHDIGKTTIPPEILKKKDPLTEEEWSILKVHPEKGYHIAAATKEFAVIAEEILYHHEHWDGSGYPKGLKGEDIPLLSRILSIVDAYDVMIRGRPYKKPKSKEEALTELTECAGAQFDPELVRIFKEMITLSKKEEI